MQRGLVSVMMPAYNAAKYIAQAIESVLSQSCDHWELIVVDDGSTDETAAVLGRFTDPRILVIAKENGGEATARNVALEHSRGEFIAFLDADDAYLPHHLEVTLSYLASHPECDAVYTDGHHINEEGRRLPTLQSRRRGPFEGRIYEQVVRASDVFGPPLCVVLRHEVVARHGLRYDPRIVIGPDWDFFVRFADVGRFGYLHDHTCLYRVHEANITSRVDATRRAGYLALCREKAIKMPSFGSCSVETRVSVFYDLLVNLLREPARRNEVTTWPEFAALPLNDQSRLLRLMASDALLNDGPRGDVQNWLERARALNPTDARAGVMSSLYRMSPALCRTMMKAKTVFGGRPRASGPFSDLRRAPKARV